MKRLGKWRLLLVFVIVLTALCAATSLILSRIAREEGVPADPPNQSVVAPKPPPDRGEKERRAARERIAALDGPQLLEAILDPSQPELQKIIEVSRKESMSQALPLLRRHHQSLPRQPYLPPATAWQSTTDPRRLADAVIQNGYQVGPYPAFPVKPPVAWSADPYKDRSWRFGLNYWAFLTPVVTMSRAPGGAPYAQFARNMALDWIEHNLTGAPSEFAWYDMGVGCRANILAVIADDALRDTAASDRDLVLLLKAAYIHALELADPKALVTRSNHGLFQLAGLLALSATLPELRDAEANRAYADRGLTGMYTKHFSAEGIHLEHSPAYHVLMITHLTLILKTGWLADNALLNTLCARAARNTIWLMHPDGDVASVADSTPTTVKDRLLYPDAPQIDYVLSQGRRGTIPQATFQVFKQSGYAAFRSPWDFTPWRNASYLFFTAAFHSRQHKHADDFTFEWSELGTRLVRDSGLFAYWKDDPRREYMESTRAHNTVEIDDRDYSRYANDVFGSAITDGGQSGGLYYVQADLNRKRWFRTNHRRIIVFDPGRWVVVMDRLASRAEHKYTQWFHFDPDLQMKTEGDGVAAPIGRARKRLQVLPLSPSKDQTVQIIRGRETLRLQGWISLVKTTIAANDAVGFTRNGKGATFVTLLHLGEAKQRITGGAVTVDKTGDSWEVRWKEEGKPAGFRYDFKEGAGRAQRIE